MSGLYGDFWGLFDDNARQTQGLENLLNQFLEKQDINYISESDGYNGIMHLAARRGDIPLLKLLISKGACVRIINGRGDYPIHDAVIGGKETVEFLLNLNSSFLFLFNNPYFNVDTVSGDGDQLIHLAAKYGKLDVLELLITRGADKNARNAATGEQPIVSAIRAGKKDIVEYLLEKGVNVNSIAGNFRNDTRLIHCAAYYSLDVFKLLIAKGADKNARNSAGKLPIHLAVQASRIDIIEFLLDEGVDPNASDAAGNQLIHSIIPSAPIYQSKFENEFKVLQLLIAKGANVNGRNREGESPLYVAVKRNEVEVAEFLLDNGADINAIGDGGAQLAHLAASSGHFAMFKLLLSKGAKPNATSVDAVDDPMHSRDITGLRDIDIVRLFLDEWHDVNSVQQTDCTFVRDSSECLIHFAVHSNDPEMVELLISKGADVNIRGGKDKLTPIMMAVLERRHTDIIKVLLEAGADPNALMRGDECILKSAVYNDDPEVVRLLISKGAKLEHPDWYGNLPLIIAAKRNNLQVFKVLLEETAIYQIANTGDFNPRKYITSPPIINKGFFFNPTKVEIKPGSDLDKAITEVEIMLEDKYQEENVIVGRKRRLR